MLNLENLEIATQSEVETMPTTAAAKVSQLHLSSSHGSAIVGDGHGSMNLTDLQISADKYDLFFS